MTGIVKPSVMGNESAAKKAANKKIAIMTNIKTIDDVDNLSMSRFSIFGAKVKSPKQKENAYKEYSQKLLAEYYDVNKDGSVSVEEVQQIEAASLNLVLDLTQQELAAMGLGELSPEQKESQSSENHSKALLFAQNLDLNGNGKIEVGEFVAFVKKVDLHDGKKDGVVCNVSEQAIFENFTKAIVKK